MLVNPSGITDVPAVATRFDWCPWLFWREASGAEQADQLAFQSHLVSNSKAVIGERVYISELAGLVSKSLVIGNSSYIAAYAYVTDDIKIGADSTINPYTTVRGKVVLGDGVRIGAHASILGFTHNYADITQPVFKQGVSQTGIIVDDDVWIGSHAIILDGICVGAHSIIAAGAVVTRDVPEYAVVAGNPARVLRDRRAPRRSAAGKSRTDIVCTLREFSNRAADQWPEVLKRSQTTVDGEPRYVNAPGEPANIFRPNCDAIEIAAAFGTVPPVLSQAGWVEILKSSQDAVTGMPIDPWKPNDSAKPLSELGDGNTTYQILSIGYALECLGSHFVHPIHVVQDMSGETLTALLERRPWRENAWGSGAWVDAFGTALWFNRHHFNLDGPIAALFDWLKGACKPNTGLWGESKDGRDWLQPVNGFYRLTRGTYAHFGLPVPHSDSAVDTILAHIRLNRGFEQHNVNACNLLDTIHPFWLLMQQTDHRKAEMLKYVENQIPLICARWVDGCGFGFSPTEKPGLQGTEMWLSILYIAVDALGLADQLGYSPRGVHWLRPADQLPVTSQHSRI